VAEVTLRRHATDVTSLVMGIVFLGVAAMWPLLHYDVLTLPGASIVLPTVLVLAGVIGLVVSMARVRRSPRPDPWEDDDLG
jgi:uncharacterized membrane protein